MNGYLRRTVTVQAAVVASQRQEPVDTQRNSLMRPSRTARGLREEAPIVADRQLSTGHLHETHAQPVQDDQPTTAFLSEGLAPSTGGARR